MVGGSPGTGKSTLSETLADNLEWTVLHSDEVRKDVVGMGHTTSATADFREGIYDHVTTDATYAELLKRARVALELGESTILDASWSSARWRTAAARVAEESASDLIELHCDAPTHVIDSRIAARRAGSGLSDATLEVAAMMRVEFDEWPTARVVDTGTSP